MVKPFEKVFENNLKALELSKRFAFITEYEVFALYALSRQVRQFAEEQGHTPVLVTIGAGVGTSSMAIREGCPNGLQFTVDIRDKAHPEGALENERNAFKDVGLKCPNQILGDSGECDRDFRKDIDFLFIDGNHEYEAVVKDILGWCPKLVVGGIVGFHDYHYSSVKTAIDHALINYKKIIELDYSIFYESIYRNYNLFPKAK